ncbi:MAG TPA: hypothetical protein VH255_01590 [Verrucomicrobiae bacterium]|nr:hypothetical protein [Verrucomicrobiae bacterium]
MADKIKAATADSLQAFKSFALNPVGELANVYNSLGEARALAVGITFGVVSALCFVVGGIIGAWHAPEFMRPSGGWYFKLFIFAFIPMVTTTASSFAARKIFRSEGPLAMDAFIAGASMLPFAFVRLVTSVFSSLPLGVTGFLVIFVGSLTVLILFFGFLRIAKLSECVCTLVVPLVMTVSIWLTFILYNHLLDSGVGFGGGVGN